MSLGKYRVDQAVIGTSIDENDFKLLDGDLVQVLEVTPDNPEMFICKVLVSHSGCIDGFKFYGHIKWLNRCTKLAEAVVPKFSTANNNDGRSLCYDCSAPTKTVMGFTNSYQVCTVCGK